MEADTKVHRVAVRLLRALNDVMHHPDLDSSTRDTAAAFASIVPQPDLTELLTGNRATGVTDGSRIGLGKNARRRARANLARLRKGQPLLRRLTTQSNAVSTEEEVVDGLGREAVTSSSCGWKTEENGMIIAHLEKRAPLSSLVIAGRTPAAIRAQASKLRIRARRDAAPDAAPQWAQFAVVGGNEEQEQQQEQEQQDGAGGPVGGAVSGGRCGQGVRWTPAEEASLLRQLRAGRTLPDITVGSHTVRALGNKILRVKGAERQRCEAAGEEIPAWAQSRKQRTAAARAARKWTEAEVAVLRSQLEAGVATKDLVVGTRAARAVEQKAMALRAELRKRHAAAGTAVPEWARKGQRRSVPASRWSPEEHERVRVQLVSGTPSRNIVVPGRGARAVQQRADKIRAMERQRCQKTGRAVPEWARPKRKRVTHATGTVS